MIAEDMYCGECGQLLIEVPTAKFDTKTGQGLKKKQCPTMLCEHYGLEHDFIREWNKGHWSEGDRCLRCGKIKDFFEP